MTDSGCFKSLPRLEQWWGNITLRSRIYILCAFRILTVAVMVSEFVFFFVNHGISNFRLAHVFLLLWLIDILFSIILIIGVAKRIRILLKIYIVFGLSEVVLGFIKFMFLLAAAHPMAFAELGFTSFFFTVSTFYFVLCANSFLVDLDDDKESLPQDEVEQLEAQHLTDIYPKMSSTTS